MTDPRFFRRSDPIPLGDIAKEIDGELENSDAATLLIHDIAELATAGPGEISVFNDPRYRAAFADNRASAVVTHRDLARHAPKGICLVFAAQPRLAYAQIGHLFYPPPALSPGIDHSAQVHPTATIGSHSRVDCGAVLGRGVEIGRRCHIAAHVVLGEGVMLGDDCRIGANTTISHALLGARVEVATSVSIGGQGFGFVPGPKGLVRMLQLGRVIIEDDVEIGANCAIDRGATGDTVIGAGTVLDNLVQIGHNVRLGRHCVLCGQVGIAGSTIVGDGVMIGGQTAISDHVKIGSGARIAGNSGVMRDVEPGQAVGGCPAVALRQWHRQTATLSRLSGRHPNKDN
jgi:UDP-3-O-[3-hydroxymyristoyl] glucosamine N-acyltransferase